MITGKLSLLSGMALAFTVLPASVNWSPANVKSLSILSLDTAEARVGRPLTPMSVAGVNRRVERRAYRRGYYGTGDYGPGAATAADYGGGYYGSGYYGGGSYGGGYGAYASAYDASGGDTYILHGNYMSEADAVAYCAQRFRSYDVESRTFLAYSGERVSCPQ
jgi:hypothetical protein